MITMSNLLEGLYRLNFSDLNKAKHVITRAFFNDPIWLKIMPDQQDRQRKLPFVYEFTLKYGLLYGEVYSISENVEGLAIWLMSDFADMTFSRILKSGGLKVPLRLGIGFSIKQARANEVTENMHKKNASFKHMYLSILAVDPEHQKKGFASKLMRPMLRRLELEKIPCYLDTAKEENVEIYKNYGFQVVDHVVFPGANQTVWGMLKTMER